MPTLSERFAFVANRLYPRMIDEAGAAVAGSPPVGRLDQLSGQKYCVVVTYRQNGEPVATPVWFGIGDGQLFFRSLAGTAKVQRIARNEEVLVAPCTIRGRPLGPAFRGRAQILAAGDAAAAAERWIQSNYGLGRRLYEWAIADADAVYVAVTPV